MRYTGYILEILPLHCWTQNRVVRRQTLVWLYMSLQWLPLDMHEGFHSPQTSPRCIVHPESFHRSQTLYINRIIFIVNSTIKKTLSQQWLVLLYLFEQYITVISVRSSVTFSFHWKSNNFWDSVFKKNDCSYLYIHVRSSRSK